MRKNVMQEKIINSNENLLVIASAGCGKTFTIVKKIERLLNSISPDEILVISFTNETVNDLKKKLDNNINILTFHKLAMKTLDENNITYSLAGEELLNLTIDDFFDNKISSEDKKKLRVYFFYFRYDNLLKDKNFLDYKKIIATFIKLMQCNNYDFDFLKAVFKNSKDKFLVSLIMKIYYLYNLEKNSSGTYDLDDMIIKAGEVAKTSFFSYKYIFVDEFQDTSEIRFNLIYNIFKSSSSTINFFGDDFQSIYAFSGCNLSIMLNIEKKIADITVMHLNKNFRSDNHLICSANNFVLKNPLQRRKNVTSDICVINSINYIYYNDIKKSVFKLLKKLELESNDIMILGRYKSDFSFISDKYRKLTIHESKGLEAKYVLILNLKDDRYGFPSNVVNNHLLNYFDSSDKFLFAEERRVFYVAVTRAKEKVFMFIPKSDESVFVDEFKKVEKKTKK